MGLEAPQKASSAEEGKSAAVAAAPTEETKRASPQKVNDSRLQVLKDDPYLAEFEGDLLLRQQKYNEWLRSFDGEGGLQAVA